MDTNEGKGSSNLESTWQEERRMCRAFRLIYCLGHAGWVVANCVVEVLLKSLTKVGI